MAACLSGLGSLVPGDQGTHLTGEYLDHLMPAWSDHNKRQEKVQQQIKKLDQQLLRLNSRRDQLSLQELSVGSELGEMQVMLKSEERSMTDQVTSGLSAAEELTDTLAKLSMASQQLTDVLLCLTQQSEDGERLLVYSDFSAWEHEEQRCSEAFEHLTTKLFTLEKGALLLNSDMTLSSEDGSFSSVGSLEQSLFLHQSPEEHDHLTAELQRLHHLLLRSSSACTAAEVQAARHKAELEEAGRALDRLSRGHYCSATELSLREEEQNVRSVVKAVQGEVEEQEALVEALVECCAGRPTTAAVAADCAAKMLRQLYYSQQQHKILSLELEQLSRQDLVSMLVQCEAEAVQQTLQLVSQATSLLTLHHHTALLRATILKQLGHCVEEDRAVGTMSAPLKALTEMLGENKSTEGDNCFSKLSDAMAAMSTTFGSDGLLLRQKSSQVEAVSTSLEQLSLQLEEAKLTLSSYSHSHALHKLWSKCGLLEECLGGTGGRLSGSLPGSWLPAPLLDAHADLETRAYQLQHDMMTFLKQYEQKKKVLNGQPELAEQQSAWTRVSSQ